MSKRERSRWNDHAGELAGDPKVNRTVKIERFVETAALDIDGAGMTAALMPQTGPTVGAKRAFKRMSRRSVARPTMWCATQ